MAIKTFGPVEASAQTQLETCLTVSGEGAHGVLCADHHKGYSMPIGGVIASKTVIMPAGVGYDIGCGNYAVRTDIDAAQVDVPRVMDEIAKVISFGVGLKNAERPDAPVLDEIAVSSLPQARDLALLAAQQLGTVGSGNHYVDLFADRRHGRLWVGVHFGSRGFGHKMASGFLALAAGKQWGDRVPDDMDAAPTTIPIGSELGNDYLEAMRLAGLYAYAGRTWVVDRVLKVLGAEAVDGVHNHHNFAWFELHGGERYLVTRKGATPAFPGQRGFVGGTMGDDAVILEGVESPESVEAFYSTVHGAGRVMGRRKAKGKTKVISKWCCRDYRKCDYKGAKGGFHVGPNGETPKCPNCGHKLALRPVEEQIEPGLIDWPSVQAEIKAKGIELRGAGADEAPGCYKRLPEVLAAMGGTIRVLHTLRPIGVVMAGADVVDPYKD